MVKTPGKRGKLVPVLLTPEVKKAIDIFLETRDLVDIHPNNPYVFARDGASLQHIRGWDVLHAVSVNANLQKPGPITSTRLRKYVATVSQISDMDENELEWLAYIKVHRDFYRLLSSVLGIAKVGKLLCTGDEGQTHKFANKTLSELTLQG